MRFRCFVESLSFGERRCVRMQGHDGLWPVWDYSDAQKKAALDKCGADAFLYLWQGSVYDWTERYKPLVEPVRNDGDAI